MRKYYIYNRISSSVSPTIKNKLTLTDNAVKLWELYTC